MSQITNKFREATLRRGVLVRSAASHPSHYHISQATCFELANLGFLVDPRSINGIDRVDLNKIIAAARKVVGADRNMTPIYPGFPKQVKDLPTSTLVMEQLLHYWTNGSFLPNYSTITREGLDLEDMVRRARRVTVMTASIAAAFFTEEIVTAPVAMSEDNVTLLKASMALSHPNLDGMGSIVDKARNGENIQHFVRLYQEATHASTTEIMNAVAPRLYHVDHLLRLILTVASRPSDEKWETNYDLAVNNLSNKHARSVRMGRLPRPTRRIILERLGGLSQDHLADNLIARKELWQRVLRTIHSYDFKLNADTLRAVEIIQEDRDYRTVNSLVEEMLTLKDPEGVISLLKTHQPGNLLRRLVSLLRVIESTTQAECLASAVREVGGSSTITTLISAYNGVVSANFTNSRVLRIPGRRNFIIERKSVEPISERHITIVSEAIKDAIRGVLKNTPAPRKPVSINSNAPVSLVRRDASTTDREILRGERFALVGEGDILRIFGHWVNNQSRSGYMDIGAIALDKEFNTLGVTTWNTWDTAREWSTYSGDCHVLPGKNAAEFFDVDLPKLRKVYPTVKWIAMTVQSWSGFPISDVDFIAGAMLRSNSDAGEVFDARSVVTAFKPTTDSLQAISLVVNLDTNELIWIDSSNGSMLECVSSSSDPTIEHILFDELERPRFTVGQLAHLWADAHSIQIVNERVDIQEIHALLDVR